MATVDPQAPELDLAAAFLPVHKLAFGAAVGVVAGLLVIILTLDATIRPPGERLPMELLSAYFSGYTVSGAGVAIGGGWGGFTGFILGWFCAFVRNFVFALQIVIVRTRANLGQTRDFLDHI